MASCSTEPSLCAITGRQGTCGAGRVGAEQVIGRGLRRTNYVPNADGLFETEYAEVYGVPFQFMPVAPPPPNGGTPPKPLTHVRALADRSACEITFPRLLGYRYELSARLHRPGGG